MDEKTRIINIKKYLKYVSITIISCSVFIILVNFNEYATKKKYFWDKSVMQHSFEQGQKVSKISNKRVQQTFKAKYKFNQIGIRFKKENTEKETIYYFVLKDSKGKELVKQKFSSNSVKNDTIKVFTFKQIKPKNKQEYQIEIYSENATDNNSIGIDTYGQEAYDVYPDGFLKINEEIVNADFAFQVQNEVERTYLSKKMYIFVAVITIIMEIFAFYPYISYNKEVRTLSEGGNIK